MKRDAFDFQAFVNGFKPSWALDIGDKAIVDLFAGGGGMSTAIEWALGRPPHIAINHSEDALSLHCVNHPQTQHYIADVFEVCPIQATQGRPVGLLHLSPDCRHFSQAGAGQPRSTKIRGLSWVGYRWAAQVKPDIITLENVKWIRTWGPLIAKRDKATGRVIKVDGSVASPGERVPVHEQFLVPDPKRAGETWRTFIRKLEALGYVVETREDCAADFGAPTTRSRLFMIARRDGQPIVWPEATHFRDPRPGQRRWRAAAEALDFSIPCYSIFDRESRGKKPLALNTMRRLARGTKQFVIDSDKPFIVPTQAAALPRSGGLPAPRMVYRPVCAYSEACIKAMLGRQKPAGADEGYRSAGMLVKFRFDSAGLPLDMPFPVITAGGNGKGRPAGAAHALGLSTAYLAQMNGGFADETGSPGRDVRHPMSTITQSGSQQQMVQHTLVPAVSRNRSRSVGHLIQMRNNCDAQPLNEPIRTISAQGLHHGLVESCLQEYDHASTGLSPEDEAKALGVARFMIEYGDLGISAEAAATMSKAELLAIVTVIVEGVPYVIVDICLRMLEPPELYAGQGFPRNYKIDRGHDGRVFTKEKQVRMCGNSVSPHHGAAIIAANCQHLRVFSEDDLQRLVALEAA
ncbi:DNA cytosine methyltransferase [Burkholderia gladioli]|uniref:DNA cytosine methyltransferase n=1 Tax=Burkholderia gladioli TaxID=28095 RepID=UPI0016421C23|nr:DNA cytosine methyltransferase [Burkholderia gladioli]